MKKIKFIQDLEYLAKNRQEKVMMITSTAASINNLQSLVGSKGGSAKLEFDSDLLLGRSSSLIKHAFRSLVKRK